MIDWIPIPLETQLSGWSKDVEDRWVQHVEVKTTGTNLIQMTFVRRVLCSRI